MVIKLGGVLERRDRADFRDSSLFDVPSYVVVKEPLLFLELAGDSDSVEQAGKAPDLRHYLQEASLAGIPKEPQLELDLDRLLPAQAWRRFEEACPDKLTLVGGGSDAAPLAARLARAQWRKGKEFRSDLKSLRSSTSQGSASFLLHRKKGILTNLQDKVKYDIAKGKQDLLCAGRLVPYEEEFFPADVQVVEEDEPMNLAPPGEAADEENVGQPVAEPTRSEKESVMKLHKNLGHPKLSDLIRVMKTSRVPERVWRWAKQNFKCPACESATHPKSARPAMIPRSYAPNTVVAMDLLQLPSCNGQSQEWYLNMICLGTSFQMIQKVRSKEPLSIWTAFTRAWVRVFGYPQIIMLDQGTEFLAEFRERTAEVGVVKGMGGCSK